MNKYQKLESKIYKRVKKTVYQSIASGCMIFNHKDYQYVNSNKGRRNYLIDQRKDIKKIAKLYSQSVYEVMQGELDYWNK